MKIETYLFTQQSVKNCFSGPQLFGHQLQVGAVGQGGLTGDDFLPVQAQQAAVHRNHAVRGPCENHVVDLVHFGFADHVADCAVDQHDLKGRHKPAPRGGDELLGNDRLQDHGELHANLALLVLREHVDNPVDGTGGADGVQGGKNQLARFRGGHRGGDGLVVAHLPNQNHVGGLPQRRAERRDISGGVARDFPLAHDALFVAVQKFNRVLNRDDVAAAGAVDFVDDAGEGGGFAASRRSGDQHQAPFLPVQVDDGVWDMERRGVRQAEREHAQHCREGAALPVGIAAEAAEAGDGEGKIVVPALQQRVDVPAFRPLVNLPENLARVARRQARFAGGADFVADAEGDRASRNHENIRGAGFHGTF